MHKSQFELAENGVLIERNGNGFSFSVYFHSDDPSELVT